MQFQPPEQNFTKGISLGLLTVFLASCVGAMGKHVSTMVDISTIVLFQYAICLLLTLPWIIKHGHSALKSTRIGQHIVRSVSGCFCFYAYYLALKHIPLVDAAMLRTTAPLLVPIILLMGFKANIPKARWLPLIVGFMGIAIILRPGQQGLSLWHLVGFSSGIGLAVSMVYTRLLAQHEPESRILFYYFFISLLFAAPFFAANYQPIPLQALPWLISIGIAMYYTFTIYTRAYSYVKASIVASTSYFAVVFAGIFDWIFWQHLPNMWTLAGVTLVIFGGLLILKQGNN